MEIPNKLKIIESISSGNYGEVYLCENTYLSNRKEAVKIITIKSQEEHDIINELNQNLFESSVLEYLKKCPYIVEVYDAEFLDNGFRINMEYLEYGSLQKILNIQKFLTAKQILKISECILHALEYSHNKDILHLDIKPGNILIESENVYKLSDFGLSNIKNINGVSNFKEIYTNHLPPEILSGNYKATEQSDIYMFGITLYRLINGDTYFKNQLEINNKKGNLNNNILKGKFPDRKNYLPHINNKIKNIINKCINIELNKRYKNVRDIRKDFGKIKLKYDWIFNDDTENTFKWDGYIEQILNLEIIAKKVNNFWELSLFKHSKNSKTKINKHCHKKLSINDLNKKLSYIFNEYI